MKNLINKYLYKHYPISKLKYNGRFVRVIIINKRVDGIFNEHNLILKFSDQRIKAKNHIINELLLVFGLPKNEIISLFDDYV